MSGPQLTELSLLFRKEHLGGDMGHGEREFLKEGRHRAGVQASEQLGLTSTLFSNINTARAWGKCPIPGLGQEKGKGNSQHCVVQENMKVLEE